MLEQIVLSEKILLTNLASCQKWYTTVNILFL